MPNSKQHKQQKWNNAYQDADFNTAPVAQVLSDNLHLLPPTNAGTLQALDLACGRAGNAQLLAQQGFEVDAMDISTVVIDGLSAFVAEQQLSITPIQRDVEHDGLGNTHYDVIVVSYFLNRALFPQIIAALKPRGLLFYQTWSQLRADDSGPSNPAFRLDAGELLHCCKPLQPIFYREDGLQGNLAAGLRNQALLIAQNS